MLLIWRFLSFSGAIQDRLSQTISLSGSISFFIEICRAPWTKYQPVEMLLSMRTNRDTKHKVTSTLRDGFETVIPASVFSWQETHCFVRPHWLVSRTKGFPRNKPKALLPQKAEPCPWAKHLASTSYLILMYPYRALSYNRYLPTYSMEQSPSWEVNWFCS